MRTHAHTRQELVPSSGPGWTALPAPSPAGQLLAPTQEPAPRSVVLQQREHLAWTPASLYQQAPRPLALALSRLRDPFLQEPLLLKDPQRAPGAHAPLLTLGGTCQTLPTSPSRRANVAS